MTTQETQLSDIELSLLDMSQDAINDGNILDEIATQCSFLESYEVNDILTSFVGSCV